MSLISFLYQKKFRDIFWQAAILIGFLGLMTFFVINASRNMRDAGIASGFDFLWRTAGIEVPFVLTDYTAQSDNLALLCRMSGHVVDVAYDGITALELAPAFHPDVVLLDIGLPVRDGYAVTRELRRTYTRPLHIVAMTGYGSDEARRRSRDAGFDLHLVKPIEPCELFDLLSRPLETLIDSPS